LYKARNPYLLFPTKKLINRRWIDEGALDFIFKIGILQEANIATLANMWSSDTCLQEWWKSLDPRDRRLQVFAMWDAVLDLMEGEIMASIGIPHSKRKQLWDPAVQSKLNSHLTPSDNPTQQRETLLKEKIPKLPSIRCIPTEQGLWIPANELFFLNGNLPTVEEKYGEIVLGFLKPYFPSPHNLPQGWSEAVSPRIRDLWFQNSMELQQLIVKAVLNRVGNNRQSLGEEDTKLLTELGIWAFQRNQPYLVEEVTLGVLNGKVGVYNIENLLLSSPYLQGEHRSKIYSVLWNKGLWATVAGNYLKISPLLNYKSLFQKAGGALQIVQVSETVNDVKLV
jgi:hypothetical protein